MDGSAPRKRFSEPLRTNESAVMHPPKRKKGNFSDDLKSFLVFLSQLNDTQKNIVRKLGFGALLEITCGTNIDDIFLWLAVQFNTTTNSIELRNGFKFNFTEFVVHTILGIPCGGLPIQTNPSKEILEKIYNLVQSSAPSTELLLSLISDDNTEENFSIIFLMLSVSCLIAPNSKEYPTKKIYSILANTQSVSNYNWCLFALSYLAHHIKKVKPDLLQKHAVIPGGCKLILVIAHFEFLITSEFKIPMNIRPRLPLWSSSLLKSFLALDSTHGENNDFGRLSFYVNINEKFSETHFKFVSNDQRYKGSKLYCLQEETELNPAALTTITITSSQPSSSNIPIQSSNTFAVAASTSAFKQQDYPCKIPSFSAITDALDSDPSRQTSDFYPTKPSSSALVPNTNFHSLPRNSHGKSPFIYSNSTNRSFQNISPQAANRFGTPIADPLMYHLLENFEAECYKKDKAAAEVKLFEKFHSATDVQKSYMMPSKQLVFSTPNQVEFFKMMNLVLPHLNISERIFQIDEVWVDQKTLTISMKPGGWLNPHTVDCYSKMLNTDQIIRGRHGLIPSSDVISHIVGREDMELLMRPLLNHSDPICRDMLSEQTVGFSLQNANFWIVITANLSTRRFFDIMNPDGSGNDKFTTIISSVTFNFKCLFAKTYPNCTSFNIKDFDYRFVPVPRTHFRYDTGIFLLQILKTYRGMGVPGFSTYDLQALRETFLYEIATCSNSQIQLPIVKSFLQNHGYRLFN